MLRFSLNKERSAVVKSLLPLQLMPEGQWADVAEINADAQWVCRLAELGVRSGSRLRLLRRGRPCLLQVGDLRLSLGSDLAMRILVRQAQIAASA
jgi:Fe2+ transport system protein FeoA